MYTPEIGTALEGLDTPCLVVDLAVVEKNIEALLESTGKSSTSVRPHMKTAKSPAFARTLIEAGAAGICVAKLSEAEVMLEAGVDDILITSEIVGEPKVSRLASLATRNPRLRIVIDSETAAYQINEKMKKSPHSLLVLIDVNVGGQLGGVKDKEEALKLAETIRGLKHLQLIGIQGYDGHLQTIPDREQRRNQCHESMKLLVEIAEYLKEKGFEIAQVTAGGTGTFEFCAEVDGISEVQPGSFIFMDLGYKKAGLNQFKQALHVLTSVISKPLPERALVDAGLKSLSSDRGNAVPALKWENLSYRPVDEEHGIVETTDGSPLELSLGDKILLVPGHTDTTVNLHDNYFCLRDNKLESICRISTRGKDQ